MKGIDVSTVQGKIEWRSVAADGVEFAMIKASQGRGEGVLTRYLRAFADSRFESNIVEAADAGLAVGVYHYFTATTEKEAIYEANYFLKTIAPYKDLISLWGAVDVESRYLDGLDKDDLTSLVKTFMLQLEYQGIAPILYTNPNFLTYRLNRADFAERDIWLAHWGVDKPMTVPNMRIWQKGTGAIRGISGVCDINEGYFEYTPNAINHYSVGDKYTIKSGDTYINGVPVPARLIGKEFTIMQVRDDRILIAEIASWIKIK